MTLSSPPNPPQSGGPSPRRERPIRSISVLMPTWQGEEFLERVMASLAEQRTGELTWDFLAIDSGSKDRTLEILQDWRQKFPVPLRVESIHQVEFDHGDTRNALAARSTGDLLVFLTQDAIPAGPDFLANLARNFEDLNVGGAYCRNLPRPDAQPVTRVLSAADPGYSPRRSEVERPPLYDKLSPHERRLLFNFNDVASAIPREIWERHPFPRAPFGEDILMARALIGAGFKTVYDVDACVEHSHDYDVEETRKRGVVDGRFNAEWLDRVCIASKGDARSLAKRLRQDDAEAISELGYEGDQAKALMREAHARRLAGFEGLHEGGTSRLRRAASSVLSDTRLRILMVVHGFPPDTWAGTEVYTLGLAKELERRGHEVVILTRAPASAPEAEGGEPEFSIHKDEFEGLKILRLVHRLEHGNLRESYRKEAIEAVFAQVLEEQQPDLVHFQHLIHLSVGLVGVAKEQGLPVVVHCHDYWSICARVQLIRPDGKRCEENMGAGCLLCIKDRHLEQVPRLKRVGRLASKPLAMLAERKEAKGGRWRSLWEGYRDVVDRQEEVLEGYAAADLLVSPSRFLRDRLLETGAFDAHRFLFSDNGIRTDHVEALEKQPDPQGRVRFGFVGTLVWYKGGEVMVQAMRQLAEAVGGDKAVLNIYGGFKPEDDAHHQMLADLAGPNVTFKGRFNNERLSEVYAEIDVLIVPSVWFENSPITIHEAYLTHTPVIASDIGGMAEFVRDGVDGLHFKTGDADDLARVMSRFVQEPGLIDSLSKDWMRVKTLEEDGADTEYRYRSLVSRSEIGNSSVVMDIDGKGAKVCEGESIPQGADMLLLRPGSRAGYSFRLRKPARLRLEVEQFALGVEEQLALGGEIWLERPDGERIALGAMPEATSEGTDRDLVTSIELDLPQGRQSVWLVAGLNGGGHHLRVRRVRLLEAQA